MVNIEGIEMPDTMEAATVITKEQLDGALLVFRAKEGLSIEDQCGFSMRIEDFLRENKVDALVMVLPSEIEAVELIVKSNNEE